jgi:hypothetical protein
MSIAIACGLRGSPAIRPRIQAKKDPAFAGPSSSGALCFFFFWLLFLLAPYGWGSVFVASSSRLFVPVIPTADLGSLTHLDRLPVAELPGVARGWQKDVSKRHARWEESFLNQSVTKIDFRRRASFSREVHENVKKFDVPGEAPPGNSGADECR